MTTYRLHVTANGAGGGEEEFDYKANYELDDMLGIMKTYMEYADHTSSFVFTVVREPKQSPFDELRDSLVGKEATAHVKPENIYHK